MTDPCSHIHRIAALEKRDDELLAELRKMSEKFDAKLDTIITQVTKIEVLEVNHRYHMDAMDRAFAKIKELDDSCKTLNEYKNKAEGMVRMAWLLWGAMGTGVGALIIRALFH